MTLSLRGCLTGFQKTITPSFAVSRLAFLRAYGGVFAIANIRCGPTAAGA